jgi:hypothetical protein
MRLFNCGVKTYQMQTLHVELVHQILLLMPYRDCLQLAKTSKRFYSIFTNCYYHSAKIEDIGHWIKFLMTGYIPQALRIPSYKDIAKLEVKDGIIQVTAKHFTCGSYTYWNSQGKSNLQVKDGILIILNIRREHLTAVPASIRNLVHLKELFFDVMQAFRR